MSKDYYDILGVSRGATDQEIKRAYRKAAQKYHPDRNQGDASAEAKFKEVNEAYEVLSDKQKRGQYDQFGSNFQGANFGGGFDGGGFDFSQFGGNGFADIFETFFGGQQTGGGRPKKGPIRGNDIEARIKISFKEAIFGAEKKLEITQLQECGNCHGKGAEPGSKISECKRCSGSGVIKQVRNTILGQMSTSTVCPDCNGDGRIPDKKCGVCHGSSRTRGKNTIKINIPAGIDDNSTIRVSGKGEAGVKGGPAGDLYIHVTIEKDPHFIRKGIDIYSDVEIHLLQAVLGDEITIESVHGPVKLKIPAGTQSHKVFKLSGYGVTAVNSHHKGDHMVTVMVKIPTKLSRKEKELYAQLAEESDIDTSQSGGFFSKIMG